MRRCLMIVFAVGVFVGLGDAEAAELPSSEFVGPPTQAQIQLERKATADLLARWANQSARAGTINASFVRIDNSRGWAKTEYRGRVLLAGRDKLCVHFQTVQTAGSPAQQPVFTDHERIVSNGKELILYDYARQSIHRGKMNNEKKRALIPLVFPIVFFLDFDADYAKEHFEMWITNQNEKAYLVSFVPKPSLRKPTFGKAFVQLNKETLFIERLFVVSPGGRDTQDYVLSGINANGAISPEFFEAANIKGWQVLDATRWFLRGIL